MLLIKNCLLIDGVSDQPVKNGMVAVDDGKVKYAGPHDAGIEAQYKDGQVIDAEGKTVMPGLIDAHVHLTMDGDADNLET